MLQAAEAGFGGCIVGSFKKRGVAEALGIDAERFRPDLVLALGRPAEKVRLETAAPDGPTAYWRDDEGVHHVPKHPLADVVL